MDTNEIVKRLTELKENLQYTNSNEFDKDVDALNRAIIIVASTDFMKNIIIDELRLYQSSFKPGKDGWSDTFSDGIEYAIDVVNDPAKLDEDD